MSFPFEPTGAEVPPAPIDIPTPDLPPANFQSIGSDLAKGALSQVDITKLGQSFLDWLAAVVGTILGILLGWIEKIIAYFIMIVFKIWNNAEGGTDAIAAAAVSGIFKVPVSASQFAQVGNASPGEGLQQDLFSVLSAALGADFVGKAAQPLSPSAAGADKFMQTVMRMAIEGWMQGWIVEAASVGIIKEFGELKDILERSLGLGRIARRVMAPPVKVLVTDPLLWLLNSTYFPTQLKSNVAIKEFIRGEMDMPTLTKLLGYEGISPNQIPALINDARPHLAVGQLVNLVNSGYMNQADAIQELQNAGYDNTTALWLWQAEQVSRQHALAKEYVAAAETAMIGRKLDIATFNGIVDGFANQASFTPDDASLGAVGSQTFGVFTTAEATIIKATALFQRSAGQQLVPLGQALAMFEQGLIGLDDYKRLLVLHGYPDGEASIDVWNANVDAAIANDLQTPWIDLWELWAFGKEQAAAQSAAAKAASAKARAIAAQTRLANAQAKAAAAIVGAEAKGVSIAKFELLVKDGLKTIPQYQAFLAAKGLAPDNVAAFTTVLQNSLNQATAARSATGLVVGSSKAKGLNLAQLESAVKLGFLSMADFETSVVELGYSQADATLLGEVLADQIKAAALKASTLSSAAAALGQRHINLGQEENAVLLGLQTIDQYQAMLVANGFAPEDVGILVGELQAKLTAAKAAAAKKVATSGLPGTRPLNLSELERLVRAGVATTADYQTALVNAGYDDTSVSELMYMLNLVLAHDQHVAAATGQSNALLTAGGLSLNQVRTAAKLGVVDISVYDQALKAAGVDNADALVLHASLAAQLAAAASTTAAVTRVSALLTAQGASLADLEAQVLWGSLALSAFQATLAGAGVSPSDVAGLTALVQDKLANQTAVNTLTTNATAAAAAKSLNLGQEAAAVKAGVVTIADYQTFVAGLGYDPADVAILVATEASKLGVPPPPPLS